MVNFKNHKKAFILMSLFNFYFINGKVLFFSYSYNRPEFIEWQFKTLKNFVEDEFDYIVFNDATNKTLFNDIEGICKRYGITCIEIPQEIHSRPYLERPNEGMYQKFFLPNVRNSNVVQWSLDNYGFFHDDILVLLDSDIFLTKKLNVRDFLLDSNLAAFLRPCFEYPVHDCKILHPNLETIRYLWIGLVFLDMKSLPNKETLNFNCGRIDNVDVDAGGYTYNYLKENPDVTVKSINRLRTREFNMTNLEKEMKKYNFMESSKKLVKKIKALGKRGIEFYFDDYFVHYFGGSNYDGLAKEYHDIKLKAFEDFFDEILKND